MTKKYHTFNIIRYRGQPNKATTLDNHVVERQEKMFIPEYNGFVPCAPYSDHFIYENPSKRLGSVYMCTCGAAAIVVGYTGYIGDASPQGKMLVCQMHSTQEKHATGGSRWA